MAKYETVDPVDPTAVELDEQVGVVNLVVDPTGADDGKSCHLLQVDWTAVAAKTVYLPVDLMFDVRETPQVEIAREISLGRTVDGDWYYRSTKTNEIIRGFESGIDVLAFLRNELDDPDNFVQTDSDYDEGFEQGIEDASEDCVNLVEYPSESDSWKAGYADAVEMHDAGPTDIVAA